MRTIVLLLLVVGVIGMLALVNNNQKQQAAPAPQASAPVQRSLENVDLKVSWRNTPPRLDDKREHQLSRNFWINPASPTS